MLAGAASKKLVTGHPFRTPSDVTLLLRDASRGSSDAFAALLPLVYDELKVLARSKLRLEREGHTLNATALVHEAYLRLVGQTETEWQGRAHFFAVASQAMRRILVDHARRRGAERRGGGEVTIPIDAAEALAAESQLSIDEVDRLLALDEALERLDRFNPRGARVVEYRFFGGLSFPEIAEVLGLSEVTARRAWTLAKSWLRQELGAYAPLEPA
jgi:RNA polymerase sigma factor (TIGR02999 family)